MLDEPHYPSKWTAAIVLIIIILMIGGVFAWAFWLNRGSLTFSADRPFIVEVNGETIDCSEKSCDVSLPPRVYSVIASSEGAYTEEFGIEVLRWNRSDKVIPFRLIPFLRTIQSESLPEYPTPAVRFSSAQGGQFNLVHDVEGQEVLITGFASLLDPKVQAVGDLALVTDQGRVFFVTISDGRKLQRFDESIVVHEALMSDNGKKILFFVESSGIDQLWVWLNETEQLVVLNWYAPPNFVQWEGGNDYRLFVVSNSLAPTDQSSVIDQVLTSVDVAQQSTMLVQVNLDTEDVVSIATFPEDKIPTNLQRRGARYFLEYSEASYDELIVK